MRGTLVCIMSNNKSSLHVCLVVKFVFITILARFRRSMKSLNGLFFVKPLMKPEAGWSANYSSDLPKNFSHLL